MPHQVDLILTLASSLTAALVFGLLTRRIGLSPIVGYLLAGVAVGPFTPGFVADVGLSHQFAEIGVVLLMFGVGLNFHVQELLAVRGVAVPGALAGIATGTTLGSIAALQFGFSVESAVVFGLTLSVTSTVVLLRVLADEDALQTRAGHVSVGWLVVEDLLTVLALVLLPLLANGGPPRSAASVSLAVVLALVKLCALIAFTWYVGGKVVPKLLAAMAKTRSRELFTLSVLVLALGIAVGAAKLFGASMALGAFLAGLIVGQSDFSARAASDALPMRDAFAVLFFVSVGMMFDPHSLVANLGLIAVALAVVLAAKPAVGFAVMRARGLPRAVALPIAAALSQIGEFSFVVASMGRQLGIMPERGVSALVVISIVCITLNPPLFRRAYASARREARDSRLPGATPFDSEADPEYRAIVVGHGPVGQSVTRLLREHAVSPTVIELNHETVAKLRAAGISAVYGDATRADILEAAGIRHASGLILTASALPADAIVRAAKQQNPNILVLARATYLTEARKLSASSAGQVVCDELEVALAMTERVLQSLGATANQLDVARDDVRHQLDERPA